jgi:hypothetical protein
MFKQNISQLDRIVRIAAGVALIWIGVTTKGALWVALIGLIPLISGLAGFCLFMHLCKCKTSCCPPKETKDECCASAETTSHSCGCSSKNTPDIPTVS